MKKGLLLILLSIFIFSGCGATHYRRYKYIVSPSSYLKQIYILDTYLGTEDEAGFKREHDRLTCTVYSSSKGYRYSCTLSDSFGSQYLDFISEKELSVEEIVGKK